MNNEELEPKITNKSKKSKILSAILIIISIVIVAYVIIDGLTGDTQGAEQYSFATVFGQWMLNWPYFLTAFLLYILAVLLDTFKISILVKSKTKRANFRISLKTSILGKYYDNITPLGSGGQPFQIYYLKKAGLTGGQAGALPIISFFLSRFGFTLLCLIAFIFFPARNVSDGIRIMAYIGCGITFIVPLCIILVSFFPKFIYGVSKNFVIFLHKIHLVKNVDIVNEKLENVLNSYSSSIMEFKDHKFSIIISLILSILYHLVLCSIPYFVVKSSIGYGIQVIDPYFNYLDCVSLGLYAYASVTFIPTPGTAGAAEFSFSSIFKQFITGGFLVYGMLYWRFIVFYFIIIVGLIITIISNLSKKRLKIHPIPIDDRKEVIQDGE